MAALKKAAKQILARYEHKKPTSLLDLPAEIWSEIGRLVIDNTTPVRPSYSGCENFCTCRKWPPPQQPAITQVSRVLREELLPYYYATKVTISVSLDHYATDKWLSAIGERNRRHVTGLTIVGPKWQIIDEEIMDIAWGIRAEIVQTKRAPDGWHEMHTIKL